MQQEVIFVMVMRHRSLQSELDGILHSSLHHRCLRHSIHNMKGFVTNMLNVCRSVTAGFG